MTAAKQEDRLSNQGALAAGVIAAALATGGMLGVGIIFDQPTIAETVADAIARLTPLETIEAMIDTFGENAKHLLFGGVLLGQIGVGAALAAISAWRQWRPTHTLVALVVVLALVGLLALPLLGAGVVGATSSAGVWGTLVSLVATALLFAATYAATMRALNPTGGFAAERGASRRAFLAKAAIAFGGLGFGAGAFQWITQRPAAEPQAAAPVPARLTMSGIGTVLADVDSPEVAAPTAPGPGELIQAIVDGIPGLSPEITPNEKFYAVSKNVLRDPSVNEQRWRLEVGGLVERAFTLTYEQMKALPAANQYFMLQCIGNAVGGDLIGNADWRGISLAALLNQAGVKPGAVDVVLRAADDYADSIPLEKAL